MKEMQQPGCTDNITIAYVTRVFAFCLMHPFLKLLLLPLLILKLCTNYMHATN